MKTYFENTDPVIPAHYAPAQLVSLAAQRGVNEEMLLRGSQIFYDDLVSGQLYINHAQLLKLVQNAVKLIPGNDASFLFGRRLLSAGINPLHSLLASSENLAEAFSFLQSHPFLATPWIFHQKIEHGDSVFLVVNDAIGLGANARFFVEAELANLMSTFRALREASLPACYYFDFQEPKHIYQYEENFGFHCHFETYVNALILPKSVFYERLPNSSATNRAISKTLCDQHPHEQILPQGFIAAVYKYLMRNVQRPVGLEQTAKHFSMSAATFKRKLKKHQYTFQQLHDLVRMQRSIYLLHLQGFNNEQVAKQLAFTDVNNFRRSFKRWTGKLPSSLKTESFSGISFT